MAVVRTWTQWIHGVGETKVKLGYSPKKTCFYVILPEPMAKILGKKWSEGASEEDAEWTFQKDVKAYKELTTSKTKVLICHFNCSARIVDESTGKVILDTKDTWMTNRTDIELGFGYFIAFEADINGEKRYINDRDEYVRLYPNDVAIPWSLDREKFVRDLKALLETLTLNAHRFFDLETQDMVALIEGGHNLLSAAPEKDVEVKA